MTHPEIVNKELRDMLATELNVVRNSFRDEMNTEYVCGLLNGLDTAFRRMQVHHDNYARRVQRLSDARRFGGRKLVVPEIRLPLSTDKETP